MAEVMVATSEADAAAVTAVEQHHAMLAGSLATRVEQLAVAGQRWQPVRDDLVAWCRDELVPHAQAEEKTLYPAAASLDTTRLLIDAMVVEHGVLIQLVDDLSRATDPIRAAGGGIALQTLFDVHVTKENEQVLPSLAQASGVDLAALLDEMHGLLGHPVHEHDGADGMHGTDGHAHESDAASAGGHQCACGEADGPDYPELDARVVPHRIRHATIFGALDAVGPGGGLVLIAPHDPLPMLTQLGRRNPGVFEVSYLERGPEAWRLLIVRNRIVDAADPGIEP